jgi:predicted RNA-binding Zn ribbon-like protein
VLAMVSAHKLPVWCQTLQVFSSTKRRTCLIFRNHLYFNWKLHATMCLCNLSMRFWGLHAMSSLLDGRPAGAVNLVGGSLCLDFVNSVGARGISTSGEVTIRDEKLRDHLDLLAWARHAGALTDNESKRLEREYLGGVNEVTAIFRRAIHLRESLYRIFTAIALKKSAEPSHLRVLNEELRLARAAEHLVARTDNFAWQWNARDPSLDRVVWSVTQSAADLLTQGDLTRVRQCEGDDCGWIFEDTSRNRSRRWCEMRDCGNIAKVRRFRRRKTKKV